MSEDSVFFLQYGLLIPAMILGGYGLRKYLKWAGLNNINRILGIGIFNLKLTSWVLTLFGWVLAVIYFITVYFKLQLMDII